MRANVAEGRALATAALALPDGPADVRMTAANGAGVLAGEQGDFAAARAHFEECLELARATGARREEARASSNLGVLALYAGDPEDAIRRYEHATAIAREVGDERTLGLLLQNLGLAYAGVGHLERAVALLEEGIETGIRTQAPGLVDSIRRGLARVLIDADPERSRALLRESLGGSSALADAHAFVFSLETAAALAADPETGARLWGAAGAMRLAAGAARQPDEAAFASRVEGTLRDAVGPAAFTGAVAAGAALSPADAVALALEPEGA
jgi:tetratricopeptide (TPR) repeat protein